MRDALLAQLYEERASLKGIALVQGLKALASLVQQEEGKPDKEAEERQRSLLDRIDALPTDHAVNLLEKEIARLKEAVIAHEAALVDLKEK